MKWIHVKAEFESEVISIGEELISDVFFTIGLKGVVCQVPLDDPPEGFGSDALPIPDRNWISGYIPETDSAPMTLDEIRRRTDSLSQMGIKVTISTEIVDQEDWAESWKQFFHVTRITDRIVIKPAWRDFTPSPEEIVIEIDPGMAFGTGTHPTTSMCIGLIEKYLSPGNRFIDVGTGSGILMIAAAKLGASFLVGVDTDEIAAQVAAENILKNGIDPSIFHVEQNTLDGLLKKNEHARSSLSKEVDNCIDIHESTGFDLVAANIIAEVLTDIMKDLKLAVRRGGVVILSGIIEERAAAIKESLKIHDFEIAEIKKESEWLAFAAVSK